MKTIFVVFVILLTCYKNVVEGHAVSGELYSSLTHMNDLFIFDKMVGKMLPLLPSYLLEVTRYKKSYACLSQDTTEIGKGDVLDVAITGNPLHSFSVIKRLLFYWPVIRWSIAVIRYIRYNCTDNFPECAWLSENSECEYNPRFMFIACPLSCRLCGRPELGELIAPLEELESRTVLPSTNDLRGASLALARLQQVYRIPIPDFATGIIASVSTCVRLTIYDCIRIANESYHVGEYANAWQWYRYADSIARDPELKWHIVSLKAPVAIEHDAKYIGNNPKFFPNYLSAQELQHPLDTRYSQLCRGRRLMDEETPAGLKCYVSSRGSPYLTLQPIKYEHLHNDPEMYMFYDVLSDKEIQVIKETAKNLLARSTAGGSLNPSEYRVSQTAWLTNQSHPYLPVIARRISAITGLFVFEGPTKALAGEILQVSSYGIGGHYMYHMDPMWKDCPEDQWNTKKMYDANHASGDRLATWMFYMSEVEAGGRTAFPNAGVSVKPVKGAAVFWYSIKANGLANQQSKHGGCPVLLGHKWVAIKWIRENENFLRRPCTLNAHE